MRWPPALLFAFIFAAVDFLMGMFILDPRICWSFYPLVALADRAKWSGGGAWLAIVNIACFAGLGLIVGHFVGRGLDRLGDWTEKRGPR